MTSQITDERGKENCTPASTSVSDKPISITPKPEEAIVPKPDSNVPFPMRQSSQRARNAAASTEIESLPRPDLSSSGSSEAIVGLPDDSSSPLAAASGRVGTLLIQIHRNRSRALIYGQLFVVGALSHQTWVSGEVLFFDVEVYNSTEKSIKKVELQLVRTTTLHSSSHADLAAKELSTESTSEILAKWLWKKGEDGWCGIAPHTQAAKIWNPIVPAGQATMNTHRFQVRYSLNILVPCTFSKTASVQIPITVISPNSLGSSRLKQHLHHAAPPGPEPSRSPLQRQGSRRPRRSREHGRPSTSSRYPDDGPRRKQSHETPREIEPNPNSIFMTSNPIPRASDELLNEMLLKLQQSTLSPRKMARLSAIGGQHRKGLSAPIQRIPIMKPLSTIGAHLRRRSSEDVRPRGFVEPASTLIPPAVMTARASFDDDILRPQHQRQRSRDLRLHHESHYVQDGVCHGSPGTMQSLGESSSSLESADLDRFARERHSYHNARRTSGNPFFKGSAGKERQRSNKYGFQAARGRRDEHRPNGVENYGPYELRDGYDGRHDRRYRQGKPVSQHTGSSYSTRAAVPRTLF